MHTTFPTAEAAALMLQTILPRACPADMGDAMRFVHSMAEDRVQRLVEWTSSRRDDGSLRGIVAVSEGRFERELWIVSDPERTDHPWFSEALERLPHVETEHISAVVDPGHYPLRIGSPAMKRSYRSSPSASSPST